MLLSNLNDVYLKLNITEYNDKLRVFGSTIKTNLQKIDGKIKKTPLQLNLTML